MGEVFWLTDAQMERLRPFFPKSRGRSRIDDRRVLSGIIFIQRNGLMWSEAANAIGSSARAERALGLWSADMRETVAPMGPRKFPKGFANA
ncbi:MAG: transposase [Paenirhodobacter sp.]